VQFLRGDQPRAGVPYTLVIDRVTTRGVTDGEGCVVARGVRPDARAAALTLHPPDAPEERYTLELRALDPADKVSGAQARLANLGFYDGPVDGASSPSFVAALQSFQRARDVPVGEALDAATAAALVAAHGA
jgi:peptidoglycan hydrolase-like protein with peptidoglycan-binding domain